MHASCPRDLYSSLPNFTTVSLTACAPSSQSSFLSPRFTCTHHFSPPFDFMFLKASVSHSLQHLGTWWRRTKLLIVSRTGKPLSLSEQGRKVLFQSGEDSNSKQTFTIPQQQLSGFSNLGKISPWSITLPSISVSKGVRHWHPHSCSLRFAQALRGVPWWAHLLITPLKLTVILPSDPHFRMS